MKNQSSVSISQGGKESKAQDINFDLNRINRKFQKYEAIQENLDQMIKEEAKLRQNIEKKTFLMHESFNEKITKVQTGFDQLSTKVLAHVEGLKDNIIVDVKNYNNKCLATLELNLKRFDEYEKHLSNLQQEKSLEIEDCKQKMFVLEELTGNQVSLIKNELCSANNKIDSIQKNINNNVLLISNDINKLKEEISLIQKDIKNLKKEKNDYNAVMSQINNNIDMLNNKNEKLNNEFSLLTKEIQAKLKHYENVNKLLNDNFTTIKGDLLTQIEDANLSSNTSFGKLKEMVLNDIKQCKVEIDKFNLNMIKENQKFIDYMHTQMKSQNEDVKKLFGYTNDDIEILKKKCDALEGIIKNIRNEMLNNINNVEGFLTQRYDSIFSSMNFNFERSFN